MPSSANAAAPVPAQQAPMPQVPTAVHPRDTTLPPAVADMRDAILEAVQSGRIDDLQYAVDFNELKPELGPDPVPDPITFWRKRSADGTGHDILAALDTLFDLPYATEPLGADPETPRLFIWPAFADRPLAALTAAETEQLVRLEGVERATRMQSGGRYTGWRLVIGADGVWHSFRRYD